MNTNWNDPNFQGFGGKQSPFGKRPPRPNRERKAIGTPLSRTLINLAVTLIFAAVYFYVVLPPINLQAEEFYFFMLLCCAVYCGCAGLTSGFQGSGAKGYFGFVKKQCRIPMIIAVALVAVAIVGGIVGWQVIRAGAYRDLLTVETGDFATEVEEIVEAQWRDLGMPETLWHCRVKEFGPLIVSIDTEGRNLFEENKVIFNERKDKAIEEICKHVSFIN